MRKVLLSVIVCLLLIGSTFFIINGVSKFKISGVKDIDKNTIL